MSVAPVGSEVCDAPRRKGTAELRQSGRLGERQAGQELNGSGVRTDAQHDDFYAPRRESEVNSPPLGGGPQPEWTDHVDVLQPVSSVAEVEDPARKVTAEKGGAKREGFFKSRDYR